MSASVWYAEQSTATTHNLLIARAQTHILKVLHQVTQAEVTDRTLHGVQAARTREQ